MLYCWGSNPDGHFGGGFEGDSHIPILTESSIKFKIISAGSRSAFGITENDEIYASGANESGQLGLNHQNSVNKFTKIDFKFKVKIVSCGWQHTLLLTEEGRVFVTGDNKKGQLGINLDSCNTFMEISCIEEKAIQVACGIWSSFVVLESGNVLFWGQFRQIRAEICKFPVLLDEMKQVSKISIGHKHILTLNFDETVSGYGCNKYGQVDLTGISGALDIFTGWNHSIIRSSPNELILIGKNDHNQLGHVDKLIKKNFLKFKEEEISDLAVGSDHNLLLTKNGKLLVWGWNEHGIMGQNHTNQLFGPPEEVEFKDSKEIKRIFCGQASCFIIK